MFICHSCGEVFSDPETKKEYHPYGMGYAAEDWSVCPCCGDNDFDEAKVCSHCGECVEETTDGLCDICYEELYGED